MKYLDTSLALLLASIFTLLSGPAFSCATCLCGDPTLTTMGAEKPFTGRLRFSLDYLDRSETSGTTGVDRTDTDEQRTTLGVSYWPAENWAIGVRLPWTSKQSTQSNLAQQSTDAIGDVDVDLRYYLWQDQPHRPRHLVGLQGGLRLPLADEETNAGVSLDIDVQPGGGLWLANIGLWHGYFSFPWMVYSSSQLSIGLDEGYGQFEYGSSIKLSSTVQYAINYQLALRLGADLRWSGRDSYADVREENSGGFIAFLSPGIVLTIAPDLILHASVQLPTIDHLNGEQQENNIYRIGMTYDF